MIYKDKITYKVTNLERANRLLHDKKKSKNMFKFI